MPASDSVYVPPDEPAQGKKTKKTAKDEEKESAFHYFCCYGVISGYLFFFYRRIAQLPMFGPYDRELAIKCHGERF